MQEYCRTTKVSDALGHLGAARQIAVVFGLLACLLFLKPAQARTTAEPPQCTAIVVPGLPHTISDGRHEAWVYKARFGRLALDGIMRGGSPIDYHFTLNGHNLEPLLVAAPKTVTSCLKAKGVSRPVRFNPHVCSGERFKVIIARPANERFLLLYVTTGNNTWRFCRASQIPIVSEPEHPRPKP